MKRASTFATLARLAALTAFAAVTAFAALASLAAAAAAMRATPAASAAARVRPHSLSARDSALHVLERFAYGPRPGEVERVAHEGALVWLEAQLAPEATADSQLAARVNGLDAFALEPGDWARLFAAGRRALRERRAQAAERPPARGEAPPALEPMRDDGDCPDPALERQELGRLLEQVRGVAMLRAVTAEAQLREVMTDFWLNHFNVFLNKGPDRCLLPAYVTPAERAGQPPGWRAPRPARGHRVTRVSRRDA